MSACTTAVPDQKASAGRRGPVSGRGFNLLETIVVLAVIGLLAAAGYPALTRILQRERAEGFLRAATAALERAKGEAAKRSVPAVVRADFQREALYGFADLDRDGRRGLAEPEILFLPLPSGAGEAESLRFWSALDAGPEGEGAVIGFTPDPDSPSLPGQVVFEPDGTARTAGAFRFGLAGTPGNFYELRVEPASTARVQLRKYVLGSAPAYLAREPGGTATWPWY